MSKLMLLAMLGLWAPAVALAQSRVLRDPGTVKLRSEALGRAQIQVIRRGAAAFRPVELDKLRLDLGIGPWILDAKRPIIEPTARLVFWRSNVVDPSGFVQMRDVLSSRIQLVFAPPAPDRLYLVYCSTSGGTFRVDGFSGGGELTFTDAPVRFVYDPAGETESEDFSIINTDGKSWLFYSCEITVLQ